MNYIKVAFVTILLTCASMAEAGGRAFSLEIDVPDVPQAAPVRAVAEDRPALEHRRRICAPNRAAITFVILYYYLKLAIPDVNRIVDYTYYATNCDPAKGHNPQDPHCLLVDKAYTFFTPSPLQRMVESLTGTKLEIPTSLHEGFSVHTPEEYNEAFQYFDSLGDEYPLIDKDGWFDTGAANEMAEVMKEKYPWYPIELYIDQIQIREDQLPSGARYSCYKWTPDKSFQPVNEEFCTIPIDNLPLDN